MEHGALQSGGLERIEAIQMKQGMGRGGTHCSERSLRMPRSVVLANIGDPLFSITVVTPVLAATLFIREESNLSFCRSRAAAVFSTQMFIIVTKLTSVWYQAKDCCS